uniref:COMM domain-containing protein 3 n=1 Tax=Acrobeloides nanus TaxID=290746 RepID=A0A914D0Z3_9BILA
MSSSNLSPTTLDYINIATTSEIAISETIETICEKLFESLLNSDRNSVNSTQFNEEIVKAVWSCAVESAQLGLEVEQLSNQLKTFNHPLTLAIINCYKKYGESLRAAVQTVGWTYPRIVDIDWRISGLMESNNQEKIKEPLVEMTFKSLSADSTSSSTFSFSCTKNQLLELRWKVKEAQNMLQKLSNS